MIGLYIFWNVMLHQQFRLAYSATDWYLWHIGVTP